MGLQLKPMFISDMAKYMSMMEGFCKIGTLAWNNNNPGNLDAGPRAKGKDARGYAIYDKISEGWADLEDLIVGILTKHPTLTLRTFFGGERDANGDVLPGGYPGYAPEADPRGANQPSTYATYIGGQLKIPIDDVLASYLPPLTPDNPTKGQQQDVG